MVRAAASSASRGRRLHLGGLIAAGLAAAALTIAAPASAGEFRVPLCHPDLNTAHKFSFTTSSDRYRSRVDCVDGNGLQVYLDGPKVLSGKSGRWTTHIPPGLTLRAYSVKVHINNAAKHMGRVCVSSVSAHECRGIEAPTFQSVSWDGGGGRSLHFRLGCFATSGCGGPANAHIWAKRVVLTLQDPTPPLVDVSGPLFSAGVKAGTQFATVSARDAESGVRTIWVDVNGKRVTMSSVNTCEPVQARPAWYREYRPCPTAVDTNLAIGTEAEPFIDGANSVRICVADVTSLDTGTSPNVDCEQRTVEIDNSCPSSAVGGVALTGGFGPMRAASVTVGYGGRPRLEGRLTDSNGDGLAGALVCLRSRVLYDGARFASLGAVRTGADGDWSLALPAGPSRSVRAVYRNDSLVRERDVDVHVRARPGFQLSARRIHGGRCVRMKGSLPNPNNGGRVVALQGRAQGYGRWVEFLTATTNRRGLFGRRYCFGATTLSTTYALRALVRQQHRYPYRTGVSLSRRLRVIVP